MTEVERLEKMDQNGQDQFEMQAALASLFLMLLQVHGLFIMVHPDGSQRIPTFLRHSTSASRNFEKHVERAPERARNICLFNFVHASSVLCPKELLQQLERIRFHCREWRHSKSLVRCQDFEFPPQKCELQMVQFPH